MSDGDQRSGPSLRVVVTDHQGRPRPDGGLARWIVRVAPARARGTVAIALVGDARMRGLNRRFAGIDAATDVLSFPSIAGEPVLAPDNAAPIGDIVIATGIARRQAQTAGHSLQTELRVLALHGLLHLLGYDHHTDAGQMARLEGRLRRLGGLREGLIERGGARRDIRR
jgi:probable rRNA maturation factor